FAACEILRGHISRVGRMRNRGARSRVAPGWVLIAAIALLLSGTVSAMAASTGGEPTVAAGSSPHPARDFTTYSPTARATRIDSREAPIIDGDLSDPVWTKAEVIDEFY